MNENFVTIASFSREWELYSLSGALESSGVKCFTFNKKMHSVNYLVSDFNGEIDLMVHRDDLEEALRILKELKFRRSGRMRFDIVYQGIRYRKEDGFCPRCDENTIYSVKLDFMERLKQYFLFGKQNFFCNHCKYEWER